MLVILTLAGVLSAYELLWTMVEKDHPGLYAKYELIDEGTHPFGQATPDHVAHHMLITDINGDGQSDYALVVVPKGGAGHAVLVLLAHGRTEKAIVLIDQAPANASGITLRAEPTATTASSRTLVVATSQGSLRRFHWRSRTHDFGEVAPE